MAGHVSYPIVYQANGQGGLSPNTAASAQLNAFREILEESPVSAQVHDHKLMEVRQATVDRYLARNGGVAEFEGEHFTVTLPRIASPQRLHTTLLRGSAESVAQKRASQYKSLEGSFLGDFGKNVAGKMDRAIKESKQLEADILAQKGKSNGMFSSAISSLVKGSIVLTETEKNKVFEPIETTIEGTNEWLKSQDIPCRIVWRQVLEPNNRIAIDTWFVFANTPEQAKDGIDYWLGSPEIIDLRDRSNKNKSRFDTYMP